MGLDRNKETSLPVGITTYVCKWQRSDMRAKNKPDFCSSFVHHCQFAESPLPRSPWLAVRPPLCRLHETRLCHNPAVRLKRLSARVIERRVILRVLSILAKVRETSWNFLAVCVALYPLWLVADSVLQYTVCGIAVRLMMVTVPMPIYFALIFQRVHV